LVWFGLIKKKQFIWLDFYFFIKFKPKLNSGCDFQRKKLVAVSHGLNNLRQLANLGINLGVKEVPMH